MFKILTKIFKFYDRRRDLLFANKFHNSFSLIYSFAVLIESFLQILDILIKLSTLFCSVFKSSNSKITSDVLQNIHAIMKQISVV